MKKVRKIWKKVSASLLVSALLVGTVPAVACADSNIMPETVTARIEKKTVVKGEEFKLHADMTPHYAEDDYLEWSIVEGNSVIRFEDAERDGDDAEFIALKKGTAKVCCRIRGTEKKAYFTVNVAAHKAKKSTIKRIGFKRRTVMLGSEFELKVRKSKGLKDRNLKWTIADTSVAGYDDDDRFDDEMDFVAIGVGKTKITCKNRLTGKKVSYTIKVVARR